MHLGNVYAALLSWLSIRQQGGRWLLRIEDLDRQRCRPEYAAQLMTDLCRLGLDWDGEVVFQSSRDALYEEAFAELKRQGLVYPCFCRRADLRAASAPHTADPANAASVYAGTCRRLSPVQRQIKAQERPPAWRVAVDEAEVSFTDGLYGLQICHLARDAGDFIVRRADGNFAYQLAVVVDDALMGVTEVVRGCDLLRSTHQQLFLYQQLGFQPPAFVHLPLLLAADGRRLAKRDRAAELGHLWERSSPETIIGQILHCCGFLEHNTPLSLADALTLFSWDKMPRENIVVEAFCRERAKESTIGNLAK